MSDPLRFACAVPVGFWHPLLPHALASLKDQEAPLEVALLDASGDPRVAETAEASGLSFAYRRQGPDGGQAAAITEGWRETGGDVVFWLNADDRLRPGALARVSALFQTEPGPDVVFGGSDFIDENGQIMGRHDQVGDATALLYRSNTISQPSCFARRTAVEKVGGLDERLHFVMDWDLWIRLHKSGARFERSEEILSAVFMGEGTKTSTVSPRRLREVHGLVRRHAGAWAALKSSLAVLTHTLNDRRGP